MRFLATGLVLALWITGAAVSAAETPDCGKAYRGMLGTIDRKKLNLSTEAQMALQRMAVRLYNACQTGHLDDPGALFDKLDRTRF
jgi:hypothetical protein